MARKSFIRKTQNFTNKFYPRYQLIKGRYIVRVKEEIEPNKFFIVERFHTIKQAEEWVMLQIEKEYPYI